MLRFVVPGDWGASVTWLYSWSRRPRLDTLCIRVFGHGGDSLEHQSGSIIDQLERLTPAPARSVGPRYHLSLVASACTMVLLPVLYLALTLVVIAAFVLWGLYSERVFENAGLYMRLLGQGGPLLAGLVMVVFMVKPLFPSRKEDARSHVLDASRNPELFRFVRAVCRWVGSPAPAEICVDNQVNASASFRRGWLSLFTGDLRLTLGLPLITGLRADEFAGVLAHEMGHFSQRGGMRLTYVVRTLSSWFAQVVFEGEMEIAREVRSSKPKGFMHDFFQLMTRSGIRASTEILRGLMLMGGAISSDLLRQMEFDADGYQARLVGPETFARTFDRMLELTVAAQAAEGQLLEVWETDGELVDNWGELVVLNARELPTEVMDEVRQQVDETPAKALDTHPSEADRCAAARALAAPGLVEAEQAVAGLFGDFEELAATMSRKSLEWMTGRPQEDVRLLPAQLVDTRARQVHGDGEALGRLSQGFMSLVRPWVVETVEAPDESDDELRERLAALRDEQLDRALAYREGIEELGGFGESLAAAQVALTLLETGFRFDPSEFGLEDGDESEVTATVQRCRDGMAGVSGKLAPFERCALGRLSHALAALGSGRLDDRIGNADDLRDQARLLVPAQRAVAAVLRQGDDLFTRCSHAELLHTNVRNHADPESVQGAYRERVEVVYARARMMVGEHLESVLYPFGPAGEELDLARHAIPAPVDSTQYEQQLAAVRQALDASAVLYSRTLGRLATILEAVETALDLEPLPNPEDPTARSSGDQSGESLTGYSIRAGEEQREVGWVDPEGNVYVGENKVGYVEGNGNAWKAFLPSGSVMSDGTLIDVNGQDVGTVRGHRVLDIEGTLMARSDVGLSPVALGGAVLILLDWHSSAKSPDSSPGAGR